MWSNLGNNCNVPKLLQNLRLNSFKHGKHGRLHFPRVYKRKKCAGTYSHLFFCKQTPIKDLCLATETLQEKERNDLKNCIMSVVWNRISIGLTIYTHWPIYALKRCKKHNLSELYIVFAYNSDIQNHCTELIDNKFVRMLTYMQF